MVKCGKPEIIVWVEITKSMGGREGQLQLHSYSPISKVIPNLSQENLLRMVDKVLSLYAGYSKCLSFKY